ncbi:coiled-coil alpha-helical rod protein 1 [Gadus chalcogrammus]|uniref:coiled-coil alpha-helical rod protein 1 n=1 Tax=Gadus chalcogrammus TaxID=1042646 RepID=UPI0024C230D9|nr:coiled-coil alpha-helical rod protein 1 [Gadus chalcogrammus]
MEEQTAAGEKLSVPTDFTAPPLPGNIQKDLMPPSHFTSAVQTSSSVRGVQTSASVRGVHNQPAAESWSSAAGPGVSNPAAAWLAVSRAQGEVLELRKENQRLMMLQGDSLRGRSRSTDSNGRFVEGGGGGGGGGEGWMRLEAEWRVRVETQRVEAERLRGQLEALKESEERQRGELRDKDSTLHRQGAELQTLRCDLGQTRSRLDQVSLELQQSLQENQKISSQLVTMEKESEEEIRRLRKEEAWSREEAHTLLRGAERSREEEEGEAKRRNIDLTTQMENLQKTHQTERQRLTASHATETEAAAVARDQLQSSLDAMATQMLQLQSHLGTASAERDALRDQLSQARQELEGQAATLQNLRGYIGEMSPERGEEERLEETVQKLSREKEALEKTADLLSVRLKCVNEILTLQEQKVLHKTLSDPQPPGGGGDGEAIRLLRLWREKVYSLCVRLRTQELEQKRERERARSGEKALQEEVQQEQLRGTLLQHSLDDRLAQLRLEEVAAQSLKEELASLGRENAELRAWKHRAGADLGAAKEALLRFGAAFAARVADVNQSQDQLNAFSQRLTFAKRRVQTIQGLLGRRAALQKLQLSSREAAQADDRVSRLQAELHLLGEEREELSQELRRTPDLIDKALAQLRETFGCQLKEQQEELDRSREALAGALSSQEEVQRREHETQARLEEAKARLEELHSQLLLQEEQSQQALREAEARLTERLREAESQVNTARREHTKAVMSLRQLDRQVTREREQGRRDQQLQVDQSQTEIQNLQRRLKETETDRNLLLASVQERGHVTEVRRARMSSSRPRDPTHNTETLLSVLGDLKALSSTVVDGSEHEEEEEGEGEGGRVRRGGERQGGEEVRVSRGRREGGEGGGGGGGRKGGREPTQLPSV